ncbi:serine/threonine-protein kinase [Undibacterium parvum]|uniref:PEGA domain-containing protein n=1 Tax=Undibacterium parvum TaxID=401471 RepID=A0A3Q9BSK7_9BURK|nr:serine/threonine-protein kinase [Undibacterium parvum]AZP13589.1 PEGA domain-containing protein [Undibacterium parvum]
MKTEETLSSSSAPVAEIGNENSLAIGTRLSDFEITGVLGEGGFGIVYLAFDHSLQRTVAIKEYIPGTLAGRARDASVAVRAERHRTTFDAGLKSFINEARLLAQFDHPALVKVYRFWEENKTAYMAMRYYEGHTLKEIISKRPELVNEAWMKFIFKQILDALETLYLSKILHRDISPDNIIVQKNGDAVLLDFGSARKIIGDLTQGLTVILKPGFAPIEQYADDGSLQQGPWTDIYALAAVMYFTLLKAPPPMSIVRVVKDSLLPLQVENHPGFTKKFLMAIDMGLAIQPEDRPQSVDEFRRLLGITAFDSARNASNSKATRSIRHAEVTLDEEASVSPMPEALPAAKTWPANKKSIPVAATLILLLILGSAYFLRGQNKATPLLSEAGTETSAAARGEIKLAIKPWGMVYVDGEQSGVSPPLKKLSLSDGKHQIRISNPGFPDFSTELEVGKDKRAIIEHEFTSK